MKRIRRWTLLVWAGLLGLWLGGCEKVTLQSYDPDPLVFVDEGHWNGLPVAEFRIQQTSQVDTFQSSLVFTTNSIVARNLDPARWGRIDFVAYIFRDQLFKSSNLVAFSDSVVGEAALALSIPSDLQFTLQDSAFHFGILEVENETNSPAAGIYQGSFEAYSVTDSLLYLNTCHGHIASDGDVFLLLDGTQQSSYLSGQFQNDSLFLGAAHSPDRSQLSGLRLAENDSTSFFRNDSLSLSLLSETGRFPDGIARFDLFLTR